MLAFRAGPKERKGRKEVVYQRVPSRIITLSFTRVRPETISQNPVLSIV